MNPKRAVKMPTLSRVAAANWRPQLVFARDNDVSSDTRRSESERVLVVEDDFLIATQMEIALTEAGFAPTLVGSAEDAIAIVKVQRPALAVIDIRLAGKRDGIDAAVQLFRDYHIRCIFATAYQDEEAQRRARPAEPLAWLRKPYTMTMLVEAVRRGLKELGR